MTHRVAAVHPPGQTRIDVHPIEIEIGHVDLKAQGLPHHFLGEVSQLDERRAERQLQALVLLESPLQLFGVDRARFDEHLPELWALVGPIEEQVQLPSRDEPAVDQNLPERHVARRFLLDRQCLLELSRRDQPPFDEQLAQAGFRGTHKGEV